MSDYSQQLSAKERRYQELVPNLVTFEDFLEANERAEESGKLVIVKFYSKKCRACLRIAALYRKLAMRHHEALDCYECMVQDSSRPLYERLEVKDVPSVQILDPQRITRLSQFSCAPKEFKKVVAKVEVAMLSMKRRRGLHLLLGQSLLDEWVIDTDESNFLGTG